MKREELDAIRERAEETSFTSAYIKGDPWKGYEVKDENNGIVVAETSTKADGEFIANARQDVPALLAEVERLRGVQKRLSNGYISLFVNYLELLDDVIPDWRGVLSDDVKKLSEALRND